MFNICNRFLRMVNASSMALQPIQWTEIESWASLFRYELEPFEAKIIGDITMQYVNSFNKYNNNTPVDEPDIPPHFDLKENRKLTVKALKRIKS